MKLDENKAPISICDSCLEQKKLVINTSLCHRCRANEIARNWRKTKKGRESSNKSIEKYKKSNKYRDCKMRKANRNVDNWVKKTESDIAFWSDRSEILKDL